MPAFMLRRKRIVKLLKACGAISEDTAKTLAEAVVFNPNAFPKVTEDLVKQGVLMRAGSKSIISTAQFRRGKTEDRGRRKMRADRFAANNLK